MIPLDNQELTSVLPQDVIKEGIEKNQVTQFLRTYWKPIVRKLFFFSVGLGLYLYFSH